MSVPATRLAIPGLLHHRIEADARERGESVTEWILAEFAAPFESESAAYGET